MEIKSEEPGAIKSLEEEVIEYLSQGCTAEQISEKVGLELQIIQSVVDGIQNEND